MSFPHPIRLELPDPTRSRSPAKMARRAIADFVESNIPRFNGWLEQVAEGIPQFDGEGNPVRDIKGSIVYLVKPNPAEALKLVTDIAEYHLPKLSRSDVQVAAKVENVGATTAENIKSIPTVELQSRLLHSLGLVNDDGTVKVQDVEARPVLMPLPSFLSGDPQPLPSKAVLALDTARLAAADLIRQHLPADKQEDALADLDRRIGDIAARGG